MISFQESPQRSWIASLGKKKKRKRKRERRGVPVAARCMKFNVDRADIVFAGLRRDSRGISRSIDRDFEERRRLRRDSSVVRRSSASSFFGIVGLVRPRHDVAGATSTTGGSFFFLPAPAIPTVSSSFFAGVHRFSSRAPVRPLEQLTTGQPWPTDCTQNPGIRHETYRSELWSELHAYFGFDEIVRTNSSTLR